MTIELYCNPDCVDGYKELLQLSYRGLNNFYTRMTRFTFNLRSASFELVELADGDELRAILFSEQQFNVLKIRCNNPVVSFYEFGSCLPVIRSIRIYDEDKRVVVDLEGYVRICCSKVIARVEQIEPKDAKLICAL